MYTLFSEYELRDVKCMIIKEVKIKIARNDYELWTLQSNMTTIYKTLKKNFIISYNL